MGDVFWNYPLYFRDPKLTYDTDFRAFAFFRFFAAFDLGFGLYASTISAIASSSFGSFGTSLNGSSPCK
jgi:hypothetical protein